jgi:hypothetical protein
MGLSSATHRTSPRNVCIAGVSFDMGTTDRPSFDALLAPGAISFRACIMQTCELSGGPYG